MAFRRLQMNFEQENAKYKCFDDLKPGTYPVKSVKLGTSQYQPELQMYAYIGDFYVILPSRISEGLRTEQSVTQINKEKWKLVYNGKDPMQGNRLQLNLKNFRKPRKRTKTETKPKPKPKPKPKAKPKPKLEPKTKTKPKQEENNLKGRKPTKTARGKTTCAAGSVKSKKIFKKK